MSYQAALASPRAPLVALHDVHEEIRAGYGSAEACVRTLDGVSLTVHTGELVVVQGGVASGAASLVAAIVGSRRVRIGARHASRGLQIRRGQIDASALHALQMAWRSSGPSATQRDAESRVLYVLRVRSPLIQARALQREHHDAWCAWGAQLRQRGGSVLAHVATAFPLLETSTTPALPRVVSESLPADQDHRDEPVTPVRVLTLVAGRIVTADPATRPWWSA